MNYIKCYAITLYHNGYVTKLIVVQHMHFLVSAFSQRTSPIPHIILQARSARCSPQEDTKLEESSLFVNKNWVCFPSSSVAIKIDRCSDVVLMAFVINILIGSCEQ